MIKRLIKDIRTKEFPFPLSTDLHSEVLGEYYFLFTEEPGKLNPLISKFDDKGIPLNRTYIDVKKQSFIYFPISIGQMGIAVYHTYLTNKSEKNEQRFINFANWFLENADLNEKTGARWLTNVELPQYKNPGPWQSAFAQARAISILLRAHQLTNDKKYLETAEKALTPFLLPVEEGGVTSFTSYGPFYEEYTCSVPTLVLNGMIFALMGVYDFCRAQPNNETAKKIFDNGVDTLAKILPEYNLGFWSKYNLCSAKWHPDIDPARISYHVLHIVQLNLMYKITGKKVFNEYSCIFKKQINIINKLRMYILKYKSLKQIGRV